MIKSRQDLLLYLQTDAQLYPKISNSWFSKIKNRIVTSPQNMQWKIYSYICSLRHAEYHKNNSLFSCGVNLNSIYHTILMLLYYRKLRNLSLQTGFQIDPNTFGKGLMIFHYGSIIVNANAKIGDYSIIYPGVVIGATNTGCPTIGHHCFIGAGSKIMGGVKIGNNVTIAPNAVVVKDVPDNAVVGGIPAKILKIKKHESTSN